MLNIVITGGTRGIGYALAGDFLNAGCRVHITGTSNDSIARGLQLFNNQLLSASVFQLDSLDGIESGFDAVIQQMPDFDIWINNAGIDQRERGSIVTDLDDIGRVIQVNSTAMMQLSSLLVPYIRDRKIRRTKTTSIYYMEGFGSNGMINPSLGIYGTSKNALSYYIKSLSKELLHEKSIIIGRLSPGMVITDLLLHGLPDDKSEAESVRKIYRILADKPERVSAYLSKKILSNKTQRPYLKWLTGPKVFFRFMRACIPRNEMKGVV